MKYYSKGDKELCQISDYRKPNSCAGELTDQYCISIVSVVIHSIQQWSYVNNYLHEAK